MCLLNERQTFSAHFQYVLFFPCQLKQSNICPSQCYLFFLWQLKQSTICPSQCYLFFPWQLKQSTICPPQCYLFYLHGLLLLILFSSSIQLKYCSLDVLQQSINLKCRYICSAYVLFDFMVIRIRIIGAYFGAFKFIGGRNLCTQRTPSTLYSCIKNVSPFAGMKLTKLSNYWIS